MADRARASPTLTGSALSVVDQAVYSASGFLTGVILARTLAPEAFGVFSLVYSGLIMLGGFQSALITGPLRVLGVRKRGENDPGYFAAQARLQVILSCILVLVAVPVVLAASGGDLATAMSFGACLLLFQLQEFARVVNLTRLDLRALLRLDALAHGTRLALLGIGAMLGWLSPASAIAIIAFACGLAVLIHGRAASAHKGHPAPLQATATANWGFGRWLLLEGFAYAASTQIYLYMTALWVDTRAAGALYAVGILVNGINVLLLGVMAYATPVARQRLIEQGYDAWRRWLWRIGLGLTGAAALFAIAITLAAEPLLTLIYRPEYAVYAHLVPILAVAVVIAAANMTFSAAFRTAELPQVGFASRLASAAVTLAIAYPMLNKWGITGAALGALATQAVWLTVYAVYVARGYLSQPPVMAKLASKHPV